MNKSKRGRKPKSNIVVNLTPSFDNDNETIIIKLKPPITKKDNLLSKIQKYDSNDDYLYKESICKNCNKKIISNMVGMPLEYNNKCFSISYGFCCYECVYKYINNNVNEYYEIYSFLKLYNNMIKNGEYPLVKEVPYNRQIKNNLKINNNKTYKLQRRKTTKNNFFNNDQ